MHAPKNMSMPAMALLRKSTGNVIFVESHTAIIAPGVGAPSKMMNSTTNMRGSSKLLGGSEGGTARARIRMMVKCSIAVEAPTKAEGHKIGAASNCSRTSTWPQLH